MSSVIVGSAVLLRGEMTVNDLREIIRSVKARIDTPITYADSWDYWLRYREMAADVDFVTIHMLPSAPSQNHARSPGRAGSTASCALQRRTAPVSGSNSASPW